MLRAMKDLVQKVSLFCNLETAMADILEDHEKRLSALEDSHGKLAAKHDGLHTRVIENEQVLGAHTRGHK